MSFSGSIRYDRRVSQDFLAHFLKGGVAHSVTEYAAKARYPVDLQMRHNPKTGADHASLYVGLTSVLNVIAKPKPVPGLALDAHKTWSEGPYGFDASWRSASPINTWAARWIEVEEYLEKVIPSASVTHGRTEGAVQAAASAFSDGTRVMLDREVTPHFLDTPVKKAVLGPISDGLADALARTKPIPGKPPASFGAECDLLALDRDGRLLAVEVKPSVSSLVWTPAQATMYARVLQAWADDDRGDSPGWRAVVTGMLEQRRQLGLAPRFTAELPDQPVVVPVIAVQREGQQRAPEQAVEGAAGPTERRCWRPVARGLRGLAVRAAGPHPALRAAGRRANVRHRTCRPRRLRSVPMTYLEAQKRQAIAWKRTTGALPAEAKQPAPYINKDGLPQGDPVEFCLPAEHASLNLLPEVRQPVLDLFTELAIPWPPAVPPSSCTTSPPHASL